MANIKSFIRGLMATGAVGNVNKSDSEQQKLDRLAKIASAVFIIALIVGLWYAGFLLWFIWAILLFLWVGLVYDSFASLSLGKGFEQALLSTIILSIFATIAYFFKPMVLKLFELIFFELIFNL